MDNVSQWPSIAAVPAHSEQRTSWRKQLFWCELLCILVILVPNLRLPGGIPFRLDDALVFTTAAFFVIRAVILWQLPQIDSIVVALLFTAIGVAVVTVLAPSVPGLSVGAKEYLDVLRPVKLLSVYVIVRSFRIMPEQLVQNIRWSVTALLLFASAQLLLLSPSSDGPFAHFSLLFSDLKEEHIRSFFGLRPFATFHTPTDLGYVATIFLAAGYSLKNLPARRRLMICSTVLLLLSGTRTFLLVLPAFFIARAFAASSLRQRFKLLAATVAALAGLTALMFVVIPKINPAFAANTSRTVEAIVSGDFEADESIYDRLQNLALVTYTWEHSKVFGVVSREKLTVAADSEYILVFHRYGLVGLAEEVAFYLAAILILRRMQSHAPDVAMWGKLVLCATALYGVTQGALINTRIGVLPILILAVRPLTNMNAPLATRDRA